MNRFAIVILAGLLGATGCAKEAPDPSSTSGEQGVGQITRVDGVRARALVAEGATLLDVRSEAEFTGGHIDGALNIPVQNLVARMGEVPTGTPVVVYCQSGGRAAAAAGMLEDVGHEVYDLGSIAAW